jgi:hypothetical protein
VFASAVLGIGFEFHVSAIDFLGVLPNEDMG